MPAILIVALVLICILLVLGIIAFFVKPRTIYSNKDERNPVENMRVIFVYDESDEENADGVRGHLEVVGEEPIHNNLYCGYIKRIADILLSFFGLVLLSPVFLIIIAAIKLDDPGPAFFTQKRVGRNKRYFKLHKFRSMKIATPHNVPTHMLENPEQYITRVGRFIRSHSLDELPQIWDIFVGNMSIIGPRSALWNQDLLTAERDKYGANDVKPGLTGWAQINGRDKLEISEKARLDGEYVKNISFLLDCRCFFGTIRSVLNDDSVVEGGTGELKRKEQEKETDENAELYYKVNRDLTVECAKKALSEQVPHFVFLSSMSVYGMNSGRIIKETEPSPTTNYGKSKLEAENDLNILANQFPNTFTVAILRPPMIYGKGCKGNYNALKKIALSVPLFPDIINRRSMLYIDNLCEFVRRIIDKKGSGLFFPQNNYYMNTTQFADTICNCHGRRLHKTKLFNPIISAMSKRVCLIEKAFGSLTYDMSLSGDTRDYCVTDIETSIRRTEEE